MSAFDIRTDALAYLGMILARTPGATAAGVEGAMFAAAPASNALLAKLLGDAIDRLPKRTPNFTRFDLRVQEIRAALMAAG